ncbi:alpha-L-rhamnosidase C-terminal domain-containing protein [Paenibacillus sp. MCAF20]
MEENRAWTASWIWAEYDNSAIAGGDRPETVLFRRSFEVPVQGEGYRLMVRVSADSRYRLYLNGESVAQGPCKGDANTYYYETIDLTDRLNAGFNVLAARVMRYPASARENGAEWGPASAWRSGTGSFLLEGSLEDGDGERLESLDSSDNWKALPLPYEALQLQPETYTLFIGGGEQVDGAKWPFGWESAPYDDAGWKQAAVIAPTHDKMYGSLSKWQLTPRPIPLMREAECDFTAIVQGDGSGRTWSRTTLSGGDLGSLTVAAGEELWLELEAQELMAGYPRLALSGGRGARITLLYSECYEYPPLPNGQRNKGVRDEPDGKALYGFTDEYTAAGYGNRDGAEIYEPFHRRAFRYIRLQVKASDEALVLERISILRTGYPMEEIGHFDASDATLKPLWNISLNTLRNCMHESYEDTPFYEQMQYEMDTRLQALFTYQVSGDDRLARKAIYDFHSSMTPSGMLQSRYPSVSRQIIPGFALFWIMMFHDHYVHFADYALVRQYRSTIDAVLGWFENRIDSTGLVGIMPEAYWSFVDWTEAWRHNAGAPPSGKSGPLTVYNLMYADALEKAAELNEVTGRRDTASEYRERADRIRIAVRAHCWSPERELYRDSPSSEDYSQHAQIWAVLTGTASDGEAQGLMQRMLNDNSLPKVTLAMSYYLFRALERTGLYDHTFQLWDAWREQADLNLTSWVEDPVSVRSDCHAWGALPLYDLPASVLGVKPLLPGYAAISITPHTGTLQWASGSCMTPKGEVAVKWAIEAGRFRLTVNRAGDTPVHVELPSGEKLLFTEKGPIVCECIIMPANYTDNDNTEGANRA